MPPLGSMQLKHLLAVSLSLLLLCVTSWASVCGVCCSLSQTCTAPQSDKLLPHGTGTCTWSIPNPYPSFALRSCGNGATD